MISGSYLYDLRSSDKEIKTENDPFAQGHMIYNHKFKDSGNLEDKVFCFHLVMGEEGSCRRWRKKIRNVSSKLIQTPVLALDTQATFLFLWTEPEPTHN